ncbi:unnamed protein product [Protopolystoma xenopodis]|uniref:Uncharacterized protein n=1 Tax=Protopolystoma xenopodis TaxID=117903 RepID=A0A448XBN9_9PLAT|nr:unnamed protein product [Protopolystoma xenopodis]
MSVTFEIQLSGLNENEPKVDRLLTKPKIPSRPVPCSSRNYRDGGQTEDESVLVILPTNPSFPIPKGCSCLVKPTWILALAKISKPTLIVFKVGSTTCLRTGRKWRTEHHDEYTFRAEQRSVLDGSQP